MVGLVVGVGVAVGVGVPDETTMVTVAPLSTLSPAAGSWLMTEPAGTVVLVSVVADHEHEPGAVELPSVPRPA